MSVTFCRRHPGKHVAFGLLIGTAPLLALTTTLRGEESQGPPHQYSHNSLVVAAASAGEPRLDKASVELADRYLIDGALAWSREKKCISCHTNGSYLAFRPALTEQLGPSPEEMRVFFTEQLAKMEETDIEQLQGNDRPT